MFLPVYCVLCSVAEIIMQPRIYFGKLVNRYKFLHILFAYHRFKLENFCILSVLHVISFLK